MSRDFNNSTTNYLSAGDHAAIDITGTALTVSAWFKSDTVGDDCLVAKGSGSTGTQYQLRLDATGDRINFIIGDATGIEEVFGTTDIGAEHRHACGVKNGTGADALKVYLSGVEEGSVTSNKTIQNTAHPLTINRSSNTAGQAYDGRIGEVGIWDIALSAPEVMALSRGMSPLLIRRTNLKAYYPLYGTGSSEPDYSGNGAHLTINGTVGAGTHHFPVMPHFVVSQDIPAPGIVPLVDAATVYVDIQVTSADVGPYSDAATVLVDLQTSGVEQFAGSFLDAATAYVDIQPSGVEFPEVVDTATVYIDITNTGGECYSTFTGELLGEGEAFLTWVTTLDQLTWYGVEELAWSPGEITVEGAHC